MAAAFAIIQARHLRRERIFRDRTNPLDYMDNEDLISKYRLSRGLIMEVCDIVQADIIRPTRRSHSLPVSLQVLTALRFYATGSFFAVTGDIHNISKSSVSRIVRDVSLSLSRQAHIYISLTQENTYRTMESFSNFANFPRVIGAIDCTHIPIKAPSADEHLYVNRKGYHSVNIQAVCDSRMQFLDVVAKWPGSTHDAFIWANSGLSGRFENGGMPNGWLLGDSGYPLRPWLLTPVLHPATQQEIRYNTAHVRTRNVIERAFGVLKMRFRCLDKFGGTLYFSPIRTCRIYVSTVILHNMCIANNIPLVNNDAVPPANGDGPVDNGPYRGRLRDGAATRRRLIANRF